MNVALIIGVTGQDGAYLARHLLSLGYKVYGTSRDCEACDTSRLSRLGILDDIEMCSLVPLDFRSVLNAVTWSKPDEIYNLSGLTSVGLSFQLPVECIESIATATINILEVIRIKGGGIKFFNAGSSECFGDTKNVSANEDTLFNPLSPYAVAKSSAFWTVSSYRRAYALFCCTGVLSNHESPLRPPRFVTQKIVSAAKAISQGHLNSLSLGNLDIYRDWGWAPDYVIAMHLLLQNTAPKDYVIASGVTSSLLDFARYAFEFFDLSFDEYVSIDSDLIRPSDLSHSSLDPSLIHSELGWQSTLSCHEIVHKLCIGELY